MNGHSFPFFFILACLTFGCQRPLIVDDDQAATNANWEIVDYESERLIQGLHSTPFEWYAISENQFARFDGENGLLEKRPLSTRADVKGIPALSDNTFARLTVDEDSRQILEFHLTKNPAEIVEFMVDSLKGSSDNSMDVEFFCRNIGAFSTDGTYFMLPTIVRPQRHYALLLFRILHNQASTEFALLEMARRIELEELPGDQGSLVNIRYFDGNFYVASEKGAWRVGTEGGVDKIFTQHMLDFFQKEDTLFATGINFFDLHKSADSGETWVRLNQNSELQWVETAGDLIFTQRAQSNIYNVIDEEMIKEKPMALPSGLDPKLSIYYDVTFFAGRYFISADRSVYFTEEVVLQ